MKICSLVPGATEVVAALGLQQNLVGISHECDYPPSLGTIPVIVRPRIDSHSLSSAHIDEQVRAHVSSTGTLYELNEQQLLAARPDLIITQNLCDVCAVTPSQLSRVTSALVPPLASSRSIPPGLRTLCKTWSRSAGHCTRKGAAFNWPRSCADDLKQSVPPFHRTEPGRRSLAWNG